MAPALKPGDSLGIEYFEEPKHIDELPEGQVVLLKDQDEWVVHRVVNKDGRNHSKGDWSYGVDSCEQVWGLVRLVNGAPSQLLFQPWIAKQSIKNTKEAHQFFRICRKVFLWISVNIIKKCS